MLLSKYYSLEEGVCVLNNFYSTASAPWRKIYITNELLMQCICL